MVKKVPCSSPSYATPSLGTGLQNGTWQVLNLPHLRTSDPRPCLLYALHCTVTRLQGTACLTALVTGKCLEAGSLAGLSWRARVHFNRDLQCLNPAGTSQGLLSGLDEKT